MKTNEKKASKLAMKKEVIRKLDVRTTLNAGYAAFSRACPPPVSVAGGGIGGPLLSTPETFSIGNFNPGTPGR
jgi:hypothetical protein